MSHVRYKTDALILIQQSIAKRTGNLTEENGLNALTIIILLYFNFNFLYEEYSSLAVLWWQMLILQSLSP